LHTFVGGAVDQAFRRPLQERISIERHSTEVQSSANSKVAGRGDETTVSLHAEVLAANKPDPDERLRRFFSNSHAKVSHVCLGVGSILSALRASVSRVLLAGMRRFPRDPLRFGIVARYVCSRFDELPKLRHRFLEWAKVLGGKIVIAWRYCTLNGRAMGAIFMGKVASIGKNVPKSWASDRHVWISASAAAVFAAFISVGYGTFSRSPTAPKQTVALPLPPVPQNPAAVLGITEEPAAINAPEPVATPYDPEKVDPASGAAVEDVSKSVQESVQEEVPVTGILRFSIKPWGLIMVDGEGKGVSPPLKRLVLPEGKHKIEVVNSGFPTYFTMIDVQKNRSLMVVHEFK
jgi:hypothetical protein